MCSCNRLLTYVGAATQRGGADSSLLQCTQEETWTAADAETMELPDSADRPKLDDPFAKLEHGNDDKRQGRDARERLTDLYSDSAAKFKDDYATNKQLRRAMR